MDLLEKLALELNGPAKNPNVKAGQSGIWDAKSTSPGPGIFTEGQQREAFLDTPEWRLVKEWRFPDGTGVALEVQVSQPPKA